MNKLPNCLMVVTAEVDPEVEADWNRWYDEVHLPDALMNRRHRHCSDRLRGLRSYPADVQITRLRHIGARARLRVVRPHP